MNGSSIFEEEQLFIYWYGAGEEYEAAAAAAAVAASTGRLTIVLEISSHKVSHRGSHFSKGTSGFKQKCIKLLMPSSG